MAGPKEAPRDSALPQLRTALDTTAMREHFQALPGFEDLVIESCQVEQVRYRPGTNCLVSYRLNVRDSKGEAGEQLVSGKIFADHLRGSVGEPREMRGQPRYGLPSAYLPEVQMMVTAFPNDCSVRGLYRLWEPRKLRPILTRAVSPLQDGLWCLSARHVGTEMISYKPERRCLIACRLKMQHKVTRERRRWILLARMYRDESGAQVYQAMQGLWKLKQTHGWELGLARPLAYDLESRILFQSQERGQLLTSFIGDTRNLSCMRRIAVGLARIHGSEVQVSRHIDPLQELNNFKRLALAASVIHPPAHRLVTILEKLGRNSRSVENATIVLIHGDFTPDQVLVKGKSVTFIDFDWTAMGDPAMDIASFSGSLCQLQAEGAMSTEVAEEADAIFRRKYAKTNPLDSFKNRLRWHRTLFLVKRSLEAIWLLKSGWRDQMERYCWLAETDLQM